MPDHAARGQPSQRFHRNRFRPTPFMEVIHSITPPATDTRLQTESARRRHSLHEYRQLATAQPTAQATRAHTTPPSSASAAHNVPSHPRPRAQLYIVDWVQDAPLGITFHRRADQDTVVKGSTHSNVAVGDSLVAINATSTLQMDYLETMAALRQVQKPATLTFSRPVDVLSHSQHAVRTSPIGEAAPGEGTTEQLLNAELRSARVQSDDMHEFLSQFTQHTHVDDSALSNTSSIGYTHLSTPTSACTLAYCLCASCHITGNASATTRLTASEVMTDHLIDVFDGLASTALSTSSSFVSTVSTFDRGRHSAASSPPPSPPRAIPLRVHGITTCQDAGTMTDLDEPSAPDLPDVDAPDTDRLERDTVVVVTSIPAATPVMAAEKSRPGQPTAPPTEPTGGPPVASLGHFIHHVLASFTAPNKLRCQSSSVPISAGQHASALPVPTPRTQSYTVEWSSPPLGLVLKRVRECVVIAEVTSGDTSTEFAVNDKLVAVNGIRVADVGFHHAVQLLQALSKPVVLSFRRPAT
ncbi:hypothetical protein DYB32_002233 [Aphanomyces invadans]|uniref:PDZ domain-containing protein n=1 Tax=Aphanomyces invadans TaxID=157072 RepID=A0A418B3X0_9STRA|nr:hypothetical protein DYB32_002233 [Aphanomyces invadans]